MILDFDPGEKFAEKNADDVFHRDKADFAARQPHEPRQALGDRDQTDQGLVVVLLLHHQGQGKIETGDEREGVCRIDRHRCQDRERLVHEIPLEPFHFGTGKRVRRDHGDPGFFEKILKFRPAMLLFHHQVARAFVDGAELLLRGQPLGTPGVDACADLSHQTCDADREEFVEIVVRDRQEPQPFKQRIFRI